MLSTAIEAAKAGGAVIRKYFQDGVSIRSKESYNLVSDADVESEEVIASLIRSAFPSHAILGEETNKDAITSDCLWIIDPLDGTNNFAHGISHFAVSIAFAEKGSVTIGVVYNPVHDVLYIAKRGHGATRNGRSVHVSAAASLSEAMLSFGVYYDRGSMMVKTLDCLRELYGKHIHGARRMGTASLDLCMIGCGEFDGHFEFTLAPWDYAAGALFVEEAGGLVTRINGNALSFEAGSVLASNSLLHPALRAIIEPHWQSVREGRL